MSPAPRIPGLQIFEPEAHEDPRGRFVETFRADDPRLHDLSGHPLTFVEDDLSFSRRGVLRGLHGDDRTWKLMQCVAGELFLAVVDLRPGSPTYRRWNGARLSAENHRQILAPPGCVNGHLVLEDAVLLYKQTAYYRGADHQIAVRWDDPAIGVEWPLDEISAAPVLSDRDASTPWLEASRSSGPDHEEA